MRWLRCSQEHQGNNPLSVALGVVSARSVREPKPDYGYPVRHGTFGHVGCRQTLWPSLGAEMPTRQLRRHHIERLRKRWTKLIKMLWNISTTPDVTEKQIVERQAHLRVHTRKPCSCWMCGHFRKVNGPTHAEQLADLRFREQLNDL